MLNRFNPAHLFLASYGNEAHRIDFRLLREAAGQGTNTVQGFSYNGLQYSFNQELNMFVNQFGHAMDIAQAAAVAESLGIDVSDFEGHEDSASHDGGKQKRSAVQSNPQLLQVFPFSIVPMRSS